MIAIKKKVVQSLETMEHKNDNDSGDQVLMFEMDDEEGRIVRQNSRKSDSQQPKPMRRRGSLYRVEQARDVPLKLSKMFSAYKWMMKTLAKYALFFIYVITFFLLIFWHTSSSLDQSSYTSSQVIVSGRRSVLAHEVHYNLREFCLRNDDYEGAQLYKNQTESLMNQLIEYEDAIILGSSTLGTKSSGSSSIQSHIHYEDVCLYASQASDSLVMTWDVSECQSFHNGVFLLGLHQAIEEYNSLVRRVISTKESSNSTFTALSSSEYLTAEEMQRVFLPPLIFASTSSFLDEGHEEYHSNHTFTNVISICFGIAAAFIYVGYRANTRRMEKVLKHNRMLPLIIPFEIAMEIRVVKDFYAEESQKLLE